MTLHVRSRLTDLLFSAVTLFLIAQTVVAALYTTAWVGLGLGLGAALLIAVLWLFSRLDIHVDARGTEASWRGWFGHRVMHSELASVQTAPYRFAEFWGWGLRFSLQGARAYSLLGLRDSVRLRTRGGQTLVLTVPDAEQLTAQIRAAADQGRSVTH